MVEDLGAVEGPEEGASGTVEPPPDTQEVGPRAPRLEVVRPPTYGPSSAAVAAAAQVAGIRSSLYAHAGRSNRRQALMAYRDSPVRRVRRRPQQPQALLPPLTV